MLIDVLLNNFYLLFARLFAAMLFDSIGNE
jgi:hypothetical protein